ncbi:uncharacterized protein LOC130195863 [Pseudoliparis swirei]|uniref:uncharacterized protein LOC130195863 n=1 Tax=Pseudoliparis swirei TaxID=2059687 RepID=UPI0024BED93F|nr:uncharacterized protein LOC130195863 [Pseudoliparis swirei]XP_056273584.1 uncharacterized protein LOC130195863 [Pseudoliparis swirei]
MEAKSMKFQLLRFLQDNRLPGSDYQSTVSLLVSTYKKQTMELKKPASATWTIGDLKDTIYSNEDNVVNGWNKFYLPEMVTMQVLGVVKGTSCPCEQLVLMTCEDTKVYGYDGEELHLVASSIKKLCFGGFKYPAAKSFDKGDAFKKMSTEDWNAVKAGAVGQQLNQKHHKLVTQEKSGFLENLKSIRSNAGAADSAGTVVAGV